ncbi:MAG: hypothetical protein HYW89_02500 [Candidatus Sungiibacteriota bacterium]|uniref:Uncharacterized protein n=1 Tax=Candidatus Sungiibacteriota bacterium TaxID=2750080 RepID=A0A7T5RKC1_9BACT|nr:MAG: hypothetical protein HYW89_02500 [Candidatus Sungbacteria bacterium]
MSATHSGGDATVKDFLETILLEGERLVAEHVRIPEPKHAELLSFEAGFRDTYFGSLREELLTKLHTRQDPYKFIRGVFSSIKSKKFLMTLEGNSEDLSHDGILKLAGIKILQALLGTALHSQGRFASDFSEDMDKVERLLGMWMETGLEMPKEEEITLRRELAKSLIDPDSVFELLKESAAARRGENKDKKDPGQYL